MQRIGRVDIVYPRRYLIRDDGFESFGDESFVLVETSGEEVDDAEVEQAHDHHHEELGSRYGDG